MSDTVRTLSFPATGQWGIYAVQSDVPITPFGRHNYVVLVDGLGVIRQEAHGNGSKGFTFSADDGNALRIKRYNQG